MITNGTEGIYHSDDKKWEDGEQTLQSTLHLPLGREDQRGEYKCSAINSIPGWKSEVCEILEMKFECKQKRRTT